MSYNTLKNPKDRRKLDTKMPCLTDVHGFGWAHF